MAKIIKQNKWYDPEGLDIQHPSEPIFEGTEKECEGKLNDMYDELKRKYSNRNDIFVERHYDLKMKPYIEVYFMSAISKDYYTIAD